MIKIRQQYTVEFLTIPDQSGWTLESNCCDVTFLNYGTEPVIVNNVVSLAQNQFILIKGNTGEIDRTIYKVQYGSGLGTKNAIVMKRNYIEDEQ